MSTHVMVVADRFTGFVHSDDVRTISGLTAEINKGVFDDGDGEVLLHEGQGVGSFERTYVQQAIDRRKLTDRIRFTGPEVAPEGRDVVHKHSENNVLLAGLRQLDEARYTADIRVHGDNELLLDHQTGEHVQGMVIVEAVRQLFLGVFERGYRNRWPLSDFYIVWNSVNLTFGNFLFPLPAEIRCTVRELSVDKPDRQLDFELDFELYQSGKLAASGQVGFSGFPRKKIAVLERRKAQKALKGHLEASA
ncbi:AfsA-related hotdog domain-containing protein [Streptomyces sp. NPDC023998]|uniref:AfsA-related hotdog domain-containing protein n=1 Tax=Streptomyces sp. NPDC023998 TaxID=3154597 RepID=UPI0034026F5B